MYFSYENIIHVQYLFLQKKALCCRNTCYDSLITGKSAKSSKSAKKPASGKQDKDVIEEVQITKLNLQGQLQAAQAQKTDVSIDFSSLPPIAK